MKYKYFIYLYSAKLVIDEVKLKFYLQQKSCIITHQMLHLKLYHNKNIFCTLIEMIHKISENKILQNFYETKKSTLVQLLSKN